MRELRIYLYYLYYQTVIQINVNRLTSSIKIKRFSHCLVKQNPTQCCIQETCLKWSFKKAKVKTMGKDLPNENNIKAGIEILIPDRVEFQKDIR